MNNTPPNNSHNHNNELGSSGKRSHRDDDHESATMDVDDLVSMISSKLEHLDTSDSVDSLIAVFMEVLKCSREEAAFFLDSAGNDLSTAVSLYLEEQAFVNRRRANTSSAPQHLPPTMLEYDQSFRRYRQTPVQIAGLPEDWEASVCPFTGVILFEHLPTGMKQNQVPPGFADAPPEPPPMSSSSSGFSSLPGAGSLRGVGMRINPAAQSFMPPFSSKCVEVDELEGKQGTFLEEDEEMEEGGQEQGLEQGGGDDIFSKGL
mmetsp:Transcript_18497/g.30832  ORF Transcript_18497/g.30832 Transcript_18497/m.30832 type:complete len:261 (+) Transcript_18497:166-948(+)|eukprot:CAMPEP_0114414456 /NCGR_PEP_ID=MMETSP0103-20121206/1398_1 /TAXON_ID=37642 ORGANISM="Paraphysomonas imperforata, Strain PA2" /NCGR_SAMPLE_ID=MMETSP0103 /ASSEMBLY_ACC=CAM_ASM_000201 /LENGTH=260 /DNA_ID=CAMNT_0001582599 /DNA_START=137 /DNA_END=919 /DNA_ORIENTATION=+